MKPRIAIAICFCAVSAAWMQQTGPEGATKPSKIEGRMVNLVSGEPVRRVNLTLHVAGRPAASLTTVSGADGHFLFPKVEPGTYRLSAERTGFLQQDFRGSLVVGAGQPVPDLVFKLTPQGVITGKVVDEEGDPVAAVLQRREELARRMRGRAEVARRHRRRADEADAVERLGDAADHPRAGQHLGRAAGHRDSLGALQHVGMARRDQHQVGEAHHLHRAGRGADVAGMAGAEQDEAGRVRSVHRGAG